MFVECKLSDLLPQTIEEFCEFGSSVSDTVQIIPLSTLSGNTNFKEISPLIVIPGLESEPVKTIQSMVSNFLYPVACVKLPDMKLSIPKMASFILPVR